jgi:hypothetical protein
LAGIFFLDLVPRDNSGESDPTIVWVKFPIPRGHEFKDADLILLLEINSSILRSADFIVFWDDFRTIYYNNFRLKPPVCSPLRFVEQAPCKPKIFNCFLLKTRNGKLIINPIMYILMNYLNTNMK